MRHAQTLDWMQRSVALRLDIDARVLPAILSLGNWLMFAWNVLQTGRSIGAVARDPLFDELLNESAAI